MLRNIIKKLLLKHLHKTQIKEKNTKATLVFTSLAMPIAPRSETDWTVFQAIFCVHLTHLFSEVGADLFADSLSHAHGCHSSWLSTTHHAVAGITIFMQVLRQLGSLTAARLPNNNHYAVVPAGGS